MKKFSAGVCLLLGCLTIVLLGGCGIMRSCFASLNVLKTIKNDYGVDTDLLENYEIVCDAKGETFTGRAPRYVVVLLEEEPTAFLQSFTDKENNTGFSSEKNTEIKDMIEGHTCMKIPDAYYPDWNQKYIWSEVGGLDKLYTVYFPNEIKLIFFEAGH